MGGPAKRKASPGRAHLEALWMFNYPELDSLRSDLRFQHMISAMGFPHKVAGTNG